MAQTSTETIFDQQFLARLARLSIMAKRLAGGRSAGGRRSARLGDGLEFADHRNYTPGDDVRLIDWPYYARMEKLLARMFHEHSEAGIAILLDTSASMAPAGEADWAGKADRLGTFDYARRVAAAMAYVAAACLERVWVFPFADSLQPPLHTSRSGGDVLAVLDFLARLSPGGRTDLLGSVRRLVDRRARPTTVLVISDLLPAGDDLSKALAILAGRGCDVSVLQVYSPWLARPPLLGPMHLIDAEDGRRLSINVTDAMIKSYSLQWDEFLARCRRTCLAGGAIYLGAASDVPIEEFVLLSLRRAGVLAG